jgi:hypothetical protein
MEQGMISLFTGLMQGKGQAQQQNIEQEYKKVLTNKLKNDIEFESIKLNAMKRAMENPTDLASVAMAGGDPMKAVMARILSGALGGMQPQQPGQMPTEQSQVTTQNSSQNVTFPGALTGLPPVVMDMLNKQLGIGHGQEITGSDLLAHPQTGESYRVPRTRMGGYDWSKAQKAPTDYHLETVTNPDGSQGFKYMPKRPPTGQQASNPINLQGPGGQQIVIDNPETWQTLQGIIANGKPAGGQPTLKAPGAMDLPIKEDDIPMWINPKTMTSPQVGVTPKQAEAQGYKRMTSQGREKVDALKGVGNVLDNIESLMSKVFGPSDEAGQKGWMIERGFGGTNRALTAWTQSNPDAAELKSRIDGTLAPLIRAAGEKGALSDTDIKRAISLMPNLRDTPEVAWRKMVGLRSLFNEIQQNTISGGGGTLGGAKRPSLQLAPSHSSQGSSRYKILKVQ